MKIFAGLLLIASSANAGWISSGGEIFHDETNPWFLNNVTEIRYCVTSSPTFSIPREKLQSNVRQAFEYWKNEFMRASQQRTGQGDFNLATQTFTEIDCADAARVDVRFQFGFETLSQEQKDFLKDPLRYIGVSVRTDYDAVTMRGKGFIYIASDTGQNAYHNNGSLVPNAWSKPQLLEYVLLHETGHVFGLPHSGGGVMSQTFLEQILNVKLYQIFSKIQFESYLSPSTETSMCLGVDLSTRQWFGVSAQMQCVVLIQNAHGGYEVFAKPHEQSPKADYVKLGMLKPVSPNLYDLRTRPAVVLNLTAEQKVFSQQQTGFREFLNGPSVVDQGGTTTFIPADGTAPKSSYARITPTSLAIFGASGPMVKPLFLYNSPLAAALMISTTTGEKK